MKLNDAVFGLLLLILGAVVLVVVQGYPKIPGQQVGPALFPGLIAAGLCIGGAMLVLRGWRQRATVPWLRLNDWLRSPQHMLGFGVLLGSVVFYIAVADALGFVPTAVLILLANFRVLQVPWLKAAVIALIATLVIHFAFYKLLRVPLPWGVLKNFTW
jgi:putative tricarboxylic transport membrane protein